MLEGFYGMVSPVFAEEVDETLENITPIAEVSNETNENERVALKTIELTHSYECGLFFNKA